MQADLVSIIVPAYNGERFIAEAIDSVLAQSYARWELIVVNDGSTDGTAGIVAGYAEPRLRRIDQANQGLAAARNAGIDAAQGAYLAFLDADDRWAPQFLDCCLQALRSAPAIVGVYTGNHHIDAAGTVLPATVRHAVEPEQLQGQLLRGGFFPPCAVVVSAQVVRDVGMFDTHLDGQGTEDWDLWLRVTEQQRMQALPEPLAFYRVYPGSMSTNAAKMHACRLSVLAKHFGPPEGDPTSWPEVKRLAYGYAQRSAALDFIAQGQPDEGWRRLAEGVHCYPALLRDLSTFYELACGDQPKGYRGQAYLLDIEASGAEMIQRLDALFASADPAVQALKGIAYGNAFQALAMLTDQAGEWAAARRHLRRAIRSHPGFLRDRLVAQRLLKLSLGQRVVGGVRYLHWSIGGNSTQ